MGYKKTFRYSTGNPIVNEVGTMNFTGNVIPIVWFIVGKKYYVFMMI